LNAQNRCTVTKIASIALTKIASSAVTKIATIAVIGHPLSNAFVPTDNFFDHAAVNIGEAEIPSGVAVC
jgi:hypothetical protein